MHAMQFSPSMPDEQVIHSSAVTIRLPETPRRFYRHGWQSWSPAAWIDPTLGLPISKPHLLHPMQHDPLYGSQPGNHGSWVGAIETSPDEVLLLGSLGLDAHVALQSQELMGVYDAGEGSWFAARGPRKAVFSKYAAKLGEILGVPPKKPVPRVWCSWYGLYTAISERLLLRVARQLEDLPFDVFQVDDGWQQAIGDWEPNSRFPSGMRALAEAIRSTGRRAGLWLAPLVATRSSLLFRGHPGWFLQDEQGQFVSAGFNWGEPLYALDTSVPEALDWLKSLMRQAREQGFDYFKVDFLYAGALPGRRSNGSMFRRGRAMGREAAYRSALQALREGMGPDAYFVACGAPIIPSLGLCDALRTGPDVAAQWQSERDAVLLQNPAAPGARNAIRTVLNRLWLSPLVQPDPDVVYFRSVECTLTPDQKKLLQALARICGFKATSDLPQWLSVEERERLNEFLSNDLPVAETGPWKFRVGDEQIDFASAVALPDAPTGWQRVQSAALGWLANRTWALRLNHELNKRAVESRVRTIRHDE